MGDTPNQPSLFDAPALAPLSVGDLVERLRSTLERGFADVWIVGEISNLSIPRSGHCYFTLKDDRAQLKVVLWRSTRQRLGFELEEGLEVLARGRVSLYEPRGDVQLIAAWIEPRGLGALTLAFERLKQRLEAEGLFAPERKRRLPTLPRRIGVVTSPTGAALRDILQVIGRRYANVRILISPTRVQGEGAAQEIAAALEAVTRMDDVDVVILGRGGGSIEDLWAFNEEPVARAVARCRVPVIAAVGHETDVTITDFVADARAPTPSAAAELVLRSKQELRARVSELGRRQLAAARDRLQAARLELSRLGRHRALVEAASLPMRRAQRLDELANRLEAAERRQLRSARTRLERLSRALAAQDVRQRLSRRREQQRAMAPLLNRLVRRQLEARRARLGRLEASLQALSPFRVLERGFSIATDQAGRVLRSAASVQPGDRVNLRLHEGSLQLSVIASKE